MQLVSVIIPTYNRASEVVHAISSALSQTHGNIEIIVVDDGSTDSTYKAVSNFSNRIHYLIKPNGGVSSARNHGIRASKGSLIAFLDSDDVWLPEKLQKQVSYLNKHPDFGMVLCDCFYFDSTGKRTGISKRREYLPYDGYLLREVLLNPSLIPSSVLVRKELLLQAGLFDESLRTAEDLDLHLNIAMIAKIGLLPEPLFGVMRGQEGLSMLSCTYDDHVHVIERFVQRYGAEVTQAVQREALFKTYLEAANGKFWQLEALHGYRYGYLAIKSASYQDIGLVAGMCVQGLKSLLKLFLKRLRV